MKKNYTTTFLLFILFLFNGFFVNAQPIIEAVDDFGYLPSGVNNGIVVTNILANDVVNGVPATLSDVTITTLFQTSPFVGIENNTAVAVAFPGPQMPGTYIIVYRISYIVNASALVSDTAIIRVVVGDCSVATPIVTSTTAPICGMLFSANVTLSGLPAGDWILHILNHDGESLPTITGNGTTTIVSNLQAFSNYTFSVYDPLVDCISPPITTTTLDIDCGYTIAMVGTFEDYNVNGVTNPGDVINYQISVTNNLTQEVAMQNVHVASYTSTLPITYSSIVLPTLAYGQTDNSTFTGQRIIVQEDINRGYVRDYVYSYSEGPSGLMVQAYALTDTYLAINDGIKFIAFLDANENGIKDNNEIDFPHANFNYEINGDGIVHHVISPSGIHVLLENNETNLYDLGITIDPLFEGLYSTSGTSYQNIAVLQGTGLNTFYFPVTMIPFDDVAAYVFPVDSPRPGFIYNNKIMYVNQGTSTVSSGTLTFTKDSALSITNISQPGTTPTTEGFTYIFTNLLPNEARFITVSMQVPVIPNISLGEVLTNSVSITTVENDINLNNNNGAISQVVVGSYDPNDKNESHGGKIIHSTFAANDYLTYIIRFENTGTASAINVRVTDAIESKLDESTVRMVDASHPYVLEQLGNNLTWKFNAINLPPSIENTNIGHGYIIFQAKPKAGYAVGDIINNTADIFFDFNPAIVTNTTQTEFVAALGVDEFKASNFALYPNPTRNIVNVAMKNGTIETASVIDMLGKIILSKVVNNNLTELDLSELSAGIYLVKLSTAGQQQTFKIAKQ